MKKYLKITLITLTLLLLILAGILFTKPGNKLVEPYLQAELEKQIGLPVEVNLYKLRYDNTELKITVNNTLNVDVVSVFNLLGLRFDGNYTIFANNFVYEGINLKQANINGEFKGVPDDIYVNGKGNTFDAPLNYYLRVIEGDAKEITVQLKDMNIAEILELTKQPAMAKGKVDANVTIPTLAKGEMNTHGIININGMTFNDKVMKERFKLAMPEAMQVDGIIDANITDSQIIGGAFMQSDVANVMLRDLHFNKETKHISSRYIVDLLNLKSLSSLLKTKLEGALLLQGTVEKKEQLKVSGITKSLGGQIDYLLADKQFSSTIKAVPVKNMLETFRFPAFVDANASGKLTYHLKEKQGESKMALGDFRLASNSITKSLALVVRKDPSSIVFGDSSLEAAINGDEINYTLMAKALDASITVDEAVINREKDSHNAKIAFAYDKYAVEGSVKGSIRSPRVGFDTKGLMPDQDFVKKAEKEVKRFFKRLF